MKNPNMTAGIVKVIAAILLFLVILMISGCKTENNDTGREPADEHSVFTGTVLESGETSLLIEPDEGSWVRNSSDKVSVSIKNTRLVNSSGAVIKVGQITAGAKVEISFSGEIAESYPAQIFDCYEVKLISNGQVKVEYKKISAEQAKSIMDENTDCILLDVRTEEEFKEQRINGAILIPDYEIKERAVAELPDKDALILIYCRSGRRSADAANELIGMGYTNVYDFGGVIDWPYETISN